MKSMKVILYLSSFFTVVMAQISWTPIYVDGNSEYKHFFLSGAFALCRGKQRRYDGYNSGHRFDKYLQGKPQSKMAAIFRRIFSIYKKITQKAVANVLCRFSRGCRRKLCWNMRCKQINLEIRLIIHDLDHLSPTRFCGF